MIFWHLTATGKQIQLKTDLSCFIYETLLDTIQDIPRQEIRCVEYINSVFLNRLNVPIAVQTSFPFVKPSEEDWFCSRSRIDWVNDKGCFFFSMLQFVIWGVLFAVTFFCVQTSPSSRQPVWTFFTGADESRREEEEGSLRSKKSHTEIALLSSFYLLLLPWRTAFPDRLAKLWRMWSPF